MRRLLVPALALLALSVWLGFSFRHTTVPPEKSTLTPPPPPDHEPATIPDPDPPGDRLLQGYGDPDTPSIRDLEKFDRVLTGYFSVVKDVTRYPIGGNADLSAALLGENANREPFLSLSSPAMNDDGQLVDRWGSPIFVHPEAARVLTLRSAGPDRELFTDDDLQWPPAGSR